MSIKLNKTPERVFLDATYTITSGKSSGIERVVRNLLRECNALSDQGKLPKTETIISSGGQFYRVTDAHKRAFEKTARLQSSILDATPELYRKSANLVCKAIPSNTARKWLLPKPGHLGLFKLLHSRREQSVLQNVVRTSQPIEPREGDWFLLPDAYWVNRLRNSVWPAANRVRAQGGMVASVIYDLIPLSHPEFVGLKRRDAFAEYLVQAIRNSDLLLAISQTVLKQLHDFVSDNSFADFEKPEMRSFELGGELATATGQVRESVKGCFAKETMPYLMVATFDPRKNHHYLIDAFDRLWSQGAELELCLVGRVGSRCDELVKRIASHPMLGKRLHHFNDLSDAELQYCYRKSRGVVFPSIVEGFGLPIVESLWFGKKTFVSDTPIHREVGRGDCSFFGLDCPGNLAASIEDWESVLRQSGMPTLPTRRPTSWEQSCAQVIDHCRDAYNGMKSGTDLLSETFQRNAA